MRSVAIVDYGVSNLDSMARAVEHCGANAHVVGHAQDLREPSHIILPGVGTFAVGMRNLRERGWVEVLRERLLDHRTPFLGVCLGMQLLATRGYEGSECAGLGMIEGEVRRLTSESENIRVPHVGWNEVTFERECRLFNAIPSGKDFYFVHSFSLCPTDLENVVARTPHGRSLVSAVQRGSIFGVQFHPEKSQKLGHQVLKNFLEI